MIDPTIAHLRPMKSTTRVILATIVVTIVVAVLLGALTIPFLFESPTMYYKFGWDKTLLRAGKMVGLTAAVFLMLQLPLAARLKWLDCIFSLPALYTLHRYNAYAILCLVIIHPIAVFAPDGILMIPFEIRYWPEWVGAALLLVICCQLGFSQWRRSVFKAYAKWLLIHRAMGVAAMVLLIVHILYVSETFEHKGIPRTLIMVSAIAILALWSWVRVQGTQIRKKAMSFVRIEPAGTDAYTITFEPLNQTPLNHLPGQFSFISFHSKHISKEPHPFTLSSSPSRPNNTECTIRGCGDWTRQVANIQQGDRVYLQGPFGRFSHLYLAPSREVIMVAGGIGITPMLSMLRYMNDIDDPRRIILLWSNQTPKHAFGLQELRAMEKKLTDFRWIPIFTREKGDTGYFGRLDRKKLASLLQSCSRNAATFLCGPPPMIKQVRLDLVEIGFPEKSIHFEAFGL